MQPWIERMIQGYEGRGRSDEAWALTQETFETHRANMSLAAADMKPWVERIVQRLFQLEWHKIYISPAETATRVTFYATHVAMLISFFVSKASCEPQASTHVIAFEMS